VKVRYAINKSNWLQSQDIRMIIKNISSSFGTQIMHEFQQNLNLGFQ